MEKSNEPGGIYIHIPFCIKKCDYCNFYSVTDLSLEHDFVEALEKEIIITAEYTDFSFDTIYLGGGTPSVLQPENIHKIINKVFEKFNILKNPEITIEINPGIINPDILKAYVQAGINRVNIGVQSFNNENLKFLGRIHTSHDAENAIKLVKDSGIENIGLDLIYGLPDQTRKLWVNDLAKAVNINPAHISCYMLTFEQGTPLDNKRLKGEFSCLNDETAGSLFETTINYLESKGFEQYEISNFARVGKRSRHNQKYWSFAPYIGMGPSAHSFIFPKRYWNVNLLGKYISDVQKSRRPVDESEILTREQQIMEAVYLGLRTKKGINIRKFENIFNISFNEIFGEIAEEFKEQGMIIGDAEFCALTKKGMRFQNSITRIFICQNF